MSPRNERSAETRADSRKSTGTRQASVQWARGPWSVYAAEDLDGNPSWGIRGEVYVAEVPQDLPGKGFEGRSNAELIASAPELYAALAELLAEFDCQRMDIDEDTDTLIQAARAALAKADGSAE